MGFACVIDQNGVIKNLLKTQYFRANQNAERLYGPSAGDTVSCSVLNRGNRATFPTVTCRHRVQFSRTGTHTHAYTMTKQTKKKTANKKPVVPDRAGNKSKQVQPTLVGRTMKTDFPKISRGYSRNQGQITVSHREHLCDVVGTGAAFTVKKIPINPGLQGSFPWLSVIALNYEKYTFKRLQYEFVPSCATSETGSVMLAIDYDAADDSPSSKQELLSYSSAVRSAPWAPCTLLSDIKDLTRTPERYTRLGSTVGDIKTYDLGNLFIGTSQNTQNYMGEVYVTYVVELYTPETVPLADRASAMFNPVGTINVANPFGTGNGILKGAGITSDTKESTIVFDQPGEYLIDYFYNGTGLSTLGPAIKLASTAFATSAIATMVDAAFTGANYQVKVKTSAPYQTVGLDFVGRATTISAGVLRVLAYAYGYA